MKRIKCITDPSLDHIDAKIIAWLLSMVFIGLVIGATMASYQDKQWRTWRARPARSIARRPPAKRK